MTGPGAAAVCQAAEAITGAARSQPPAPGHDEDFCALTLACGQVLDALAELNASIVAQLTRHGSQHRLRTTSGRTPGQVLTSAMDHARDLETALCQGSHAAGALAAECAQLETHPGEPRQ